MNSWYENWVRNNHGELAKKSGALVLNADLWDALITARSRLEKEGVLLNLVWVKGHNGDVGNEAADRLAVNGITEVPLSMRKSR